VTSYPFSPEILAHWRQRVARVGSSSLLSSLFLVFLLRLPHTLNRRRRRELLTTETELKAMAAEARIGLSRIPQKG
jgi:hypothetical protein